MPLGHTLPDNVKVGPIHVHNVYIINNIHMYILALNN